ncbi:MAG: hypothetical protein AAGC57_04920 [Pseudomonadota bacterium]
MRAIFAAHLLPLLLCGCFATVMDGAGRAIMVGGEVAARAYLTENARVRSELSLGAQFMTDAVLAFRQYQLGRQIIEASTGRSARVVTDGPQIAEVAQ